MSPDAGTYNSQRPPRHCSQGSSWCWREEGLRGGAHHGHARRAQQAAAALDVAILQRLRAQPLAWPAGMG